MTSKHLALIDFQISQNNWLENHIIKSQSINWAKEYLRPNLKSIILIQYYSLKDKKDSNLSFSNSSLRIDSVLKIVHRSELVERGQSEDIDRNRT